MSKFKARSLANSWLVLKSALEKFFFTPSTARPIAALRISLAALLLLQAFTMRDAMYDFFSSDGIVQKSLAAALWNAPIPNIPNINWLNDWVLPGNLDERTAIAWVCSAYVVALGFFGLGLFTRVAAIAVWFLQWTLDNTGFFVHYGVDIYSHIFLFYLMLSPCGSVWSVDAWRKKAPEIASWQNQLSLRVMQIHLAISYLVTGILKAQGEQWWNGELIWRSLTLPIYAQFDLQWLGQWPLLLAIAGWLTLVVEIGYFVFIWPKATRKLWIALTVSLHIGIVVFLGLHYFGFLMSIFTLCLFGVSAEPSKLLATEKRTFLPNEPGLVIFDGECNLCNRWVRFVDQRDPEHKLRFIPRSSLEAETVLKDLGHELSTGDSATIYLVHAGQVFERSDAVLMISRFLVGAWPLCSHLGVLPLALRDGTYRFIARNRYRWFGKTEQCDLATARRVMGAKLKD